MSKPFQRAHKTANCLKYNNNNNNRQYDEVNLPDSVISVVEGRSTYYGLAILSLFLSSFLLDNKKTVVINSRIGTYAEVGPTSIVPL